MRHIIRIHLLTILLISNVFSYENAFSHSSTGKINLQNSPELTDVNGGYSRLVKIGQGHTTEAGMPELPQFTTYYQLDPEKTYDFQLEVLDSYTIEDITILPHQGMEKWEVDAVSIINEEVYNSYAALPQQNMVLSERIQGRGIEFVSIQVIPYKYYPKYKKLEVFTDVDIHVIETGDNPTPQLTQPKRSRIFDEFYKDMIVNFEYSDRPDDYQASSILYIGGGDWLNNSYVQDLLDWRHRQGYLVHAVSTSEIGASNGNENTIKNYIKDAYETWENPPEIVGLIGDTDVIDCFYHNWSGYNGATDFDYTQLNGSDLISDVFIGRISAQSSSIMGAVINKTIQYEKASYVGDEWFKRAVLVGDPYPSGISNVFTSQYVENIMINHGMTDVVTDYDGSGINSFVNQQFENGVLYYNYRGWYYGAGSYPDNCCDNGYQTPFVTTITCGTGDFDSGNSSSESWVEMGSINNPQGAVAAVGVSTAGTHTAYNNIVDMGIYDGIFPKDLWYAGAVTSNGHLSILATYPSNPSGATETFISWTNLMGDPALHLWTDVPTDFSFAHPSSISLGTTMLELTITDENNNTVEGARVTLLMGDDVIFTTGLTDDNGQITLSWDAVEAGIMDITVIKRNHRPYEGSIEIFSAGTAVSMDSGILEATSGEEENFDISLHNFGSITANNVMAELSSPSEYVNIDNKIISYGTIMPGSSVSKSFPVTIHGTAFLMEELDFKLTITDDNGNTWINAVPVYVEGPYLIVSDYASDILPGSNTMLVLNLDNQGSRSLSNYSLEFLPYDNLISVYSEPISISELSVGGNISLDDFELGFSSDIINGTVLPLELLLTSSDGFTRSHLVNITVGEVRESDPLGPDTFGYYIYDSGDTDYDQAPDYEWIEIANSSNDLNLIDYGNGCFNSNTSACNGYGAADYGDYTASSKWVRPLPFVFTFYGVDYDDMVINTNGWISFGNFAMYSFRNYPIPGAGGPSPMVAAFWDDLKITSSGNVYYAEYPEYVVIQWDEMKTYDNNSDETFQIILYNKEYYPSTETGDSEIKIQYKEFNNTSDGYYPSGGTPTHGCYSTIGIENHLGDMGLEYTFNNSYPEAAMTLDDETALYITTNPPEALPAPQLSYTHDNLDFTLNQGGSSSSSMTISNIGEEGSVLSYSVSKTGISPFEDLGGGPDNFGYLWSDSEIEEVAHYNWIDIDDIGNQLSFPHNDIAAEPVDMGFEFPFYGEGYTECIINPNGWVGFGEDNVAFSNTSLPSTSAPKSAIFGFWDDLNPISIDQGGCPAGLGNVYTYTDNDLFVIWFDHVSRCASGDETMGIYDFQFVLHENGDIDLNYRDMSGYTTSATIGMQNETGSDGLLVIYNDTYVQSQLSLKYRMSDEADWLSLSGDLSSDLLYSESTVIDITAQASSLTTGEYNGEIIISSNSQSVVTIPVSLLVVDDGLLGDVNDDGVLNILDVVSLVNIILNGDDYILAGDMNQDGSLDVLDIVTLVNIILS